MVRNIFNCSFQFQVIDVAEMLLINFIEYILRRLVTMSQSFSQGFLNAKMNRFGLNLSSPQIHLLSTPRIHSDVEGLPSRTSDEQVILQVTLNTGNKNKIIFNLPFYQTITINKFQLCKTL